MAQNSFVGKSCIGKLNIICKKLIAIMIILTVCVTFMPWQVNADAEGLDLRAQSACSYCPRTGEFVFQMDMNKRVYPASTTKLMTAILAVEKLDLNDTIVVTPEIEAVAESEMFLQRGEVVTINDLLHGMLIESDNDAAVALAIAAAGNVDDFVKMMNKRAKKYGCKDTHFVNPNGIKVSGHYSTAHDMALIAAKAFKNKTIRTICGKPKYKMKATNGYTERVFENTNLLIRDDLKIKIHGEEVVPKYPGVFAGKTGTWEKNEASLIAAVKDGDFEFITVVMNTLYKRRELESMELIDYTKENLSRDIAFEKGESFGHCFVMHGAKTFIKAVAGEVGYVRLPNGVTLDDIDIDTESNDNITPPIKKGDVIGKIIISYDGKILRKVKMIAGESTEEGWLPSYIGISNLATTIILVILGLFYGTRTYFRIRSKIRRKRRKRRRTRRA